MIEQPSQPIYLNEIDDTTREATYVAEASTQAQPALSPPSNQHRPKQPPPQPARPFTALIDQELANQRRLLDLTASKAAAHLQGIYIMYKLDLTPPIYSMSSLNFKDVQDMKCHCHRPIHLIL